MSEEVKESITTEDKQEESTPTPAVPAPVQAKKRSILRWLLDAKIFNKHTGKFVILLVLLLWVTNPSLIPFLPSGAKERLTGYAEWLLGDVKTIYEVLPISRVKIIQIAVMILFLCLIAEIAKNILENIHFYEKNSKAFATVFSTGKKFRTFETVLLSSTKYIFTIIGVIWALEIMGVDTKVILAGVGITALIIGFGADALVKDMVTGVFLLFDHEYDIGDIIDVGEFHGEVVRIGFRSTSLKDQGGNIKIINNSNMRDIINRSKEDSRAVCDISIPAKLNLSDVEDTVAHLLDELWKKEDVFLEKPEYWGIESIKGQEITIRIVAWVKEIDVYKAQRLINRAVKLDFQELGVWR